MATEVLLNHAAAVLQLHNLCLKMCASKDVLETKRLFTSGLDVLKCLQGCSARQWQILIYLLLGHRNLIVDECPAIDERILNLLCMHPDAVPSDLFQDRLPSHIVIRINELLPGL